MKNIPDSSKIKKRLVYTKSLILKNDHYNTFNHVVDCLEAICEHTPLQAEQCAILTHYKGKCVIKKGELKDLEIIKQDLVEIKNGFGTHTG